MRLESFRFRAMGSPCELKLWGDSRHSAATIAEACGREIDRLERKFSRYRDDSLATRINRSAGDTAGVELDSEAAALLDFAATAYRESNGRFDPTAGVLRRVGNFKSGRLPSADAVQEILPLVGWSKLRWEDSRIVLPIPGMELDFGGFVKEYAADRAAELCRKRGLKSGIIDLGGDLAVVGPHPDGQPWLVGIRNPRRPSEAIARIALYSGGLATSGDYERFMIVNGKRYSHLLDPRTGEPHNGGPACVSITADHCLIAGSTSTIAMLQSEADASRFLEEVGLPHLLVTQAGRISGTADCINTAGDPVRERPGDRPSHPMSALRSAC
jgi:thiamine biosynthesis lipoprotein